MNGAATNTVPAPIVETPVQRDFPSIITKVAHELERYLFLKDKSLYQFLAAWIIGTYLAVDHFEYYGYLLFTSTGPECGKTRALELLDALCWKSDGILTDPTKAVIFATANSCTQLLDEIDSWPDKTDLRSVLNSGFHRNGNVKRMWKDTDGNFSKIRTIPVYGPKALAGIGDKLPLNDVTKSRVFEIAMLQQLKSERRERLTKNVRQSLGVLKQEIERWVQTNGPRIVEVYEGEFPYLDNFGDRTIDICRPIAAVLEVAYPGDRKVRRELLRIMPIVRPNFEKKDNALLILEKLREQIADAEPLIGTPTELAARINPTLTEPVSEYDVSEVLRRFGFKSRGIRLNGGNPQHRYSLTKAELDNHLARFDVATSVATCVAGEGTPDST